MRCFQRNFGFALAFALVVLATHAARAVEPSTAQRDQYWPQWRGPLDTGFSPTAHPPAEWSEDKNIKWKVKLPGAGSSTPIIWGDKILIHAAIPTGKKVDKAQDTASPAPPDDPKPAPPPDAKGPPPGGRGRGGFGNVQKPDEVHQWVLLCLDRATGNEIWKKVAREEVPHEGHHPDHGYASYSPATDGKYIVSFLGSRGLHCYDMDGNLKWEKDLGRMKMIFNFGEGASPALSGNTVVVQWDHEGDSFIAAFDVRTGDELWRTPREEKSTWASPLIVTYDGKSQVVTSSKQKARGYDLETGKQIWECGGLTPNGIPTPVAADGIVYIMNGFMGSSLLAIQLGHTGDLTGSDAVLWKSDKNTPYVPSPLLYGNRLYFNKVNDAILTCLDDKTGKTLFGPERMEGLKNAYASPVGADGRIYFVGRNGTTMVIRDSDTFDMISTNKLDEPIDASPALAGKELFLRGKDSLYCISEK